MRPGHPSRRSRDDPRWARLHQSAHQAWLLGKAGGRPPELPAYRRRRNGEAPLQQRAICGWEIEAPDFPGADLTKTRAVVGEALIPDRRGIALAEKARLAWRRICLSVSSGAKPACSRRRMTRRRPGWYMRAVSRIEAVRQDIPIEYEDGCSSFRATLEPIYLRYADLLLRRLDSQPTGVRGRRGCRQWSRPSS